MNLFAGIWGIIKRCNIIFFQYIYLRVISIIHYNYFKRIFFFIIYQEFSFNSVTFLKVTSLENDRFIQIIEETSYSNIA